MVIVARLKKKNMAAPTQIAIVAAGCFWGVEHYFIKNFGEKLVSTAVGYTGGAAEDPTYKLVCTGKTGHAEAVKIEFKPDQVSFEDLVRYFFRIHDPTTLNRQQGDHGTQYRSGIYYLSPEQQKIAETVKLEVTPKWTELRPGAQIVTEILPAGKWYDAEEYHQKYLINNAGGYCSHRVYW